MPTTQYVFNTQSIGVKARHYNWFEPRVPAALTSHLFQKNLSREQELQLRFLLKERKKNVRRIRAAREDKIRRGRSWPESGLDISRRAKQRTVIKEVRSDLRSCW